MSNILNTDSYKASHFLQFPPKTSGIYSYIESRGGKFDRTLFFGLQMFIKEKLLTPITAEDINEAEEVIVAHGLPFNRAGWERILHVHKGYLPIEIRAVEEGRVIPTHNVLASVVNTDAELPWITNYVETPLLRAIWYPTTVATLSWHAKQMIKANMEQTCDTLDGLPFKLHDFGARGVSSEESAKLGGVAHLVNFMGTDTLSGIMAAKKYYGVKDMPGFSIPAMEHSTVTSWGKYGEQDAFLSMIRNSAKPGGLIACVSDSYDLWNAVNNIWGDALKEEVINCGATVVVRPDSGNPLTVPVHYIELLGEKFGFTINTKGYKVLPGCIRVIQGDGINIDSLPEIMNNLKSSGWSMDNLAFGMGGGLLQQVNRDTQKFAMKASAVRIGDVNSEWMGIAKDPVTDHGKKSKMGRFVLSREHGKWETHNIHTGHDWANWLGIAYTHRENMQSPVTRSKTLAEIRELSNQPAYD
jgi:nicotinamide phosphoribosyltransferase